MSGSLSVDLRAGYRDLLRGLGEGDQLAVSLARVLSNGDRPEDKSGALRTVVLLYRAGPRDVWGPVVLDLLAPSILARLQRLKPRPPVMDPEDVRQELVFQVLKAAACIPLPEDPWCLRNRIMSRANQGVRRWLVREGRRQARQRSLESAEGNRT